MIEAIRNISDTSFVGFSSNDDGECVHIATSTQSFYLSEVKQKKGKSKKSDKDDD